MSKYKFFFVLILLSLIICSQSVGKNVWTVVRQSKTETHFSSIQFLDKDNGWIASWSGIMASTKDGGKTWTPQESGTSNWIFDICNSGNKLWAVGLKGTILKFSESAKS